MFQKKEILKRLYKRKNLNKKLINKFRNIQLPIDYKKKNSDFVIKNNFTKRSVKVQINNILKNFNK